MSKATYKDAGVDLARYEQSMARLPKLLARTHSPRVLKAEGGFAGLFQLDFSSPLFARHYHDPVLVSSTDGVGTKLKVAQQMGLHDTVGVDLVAMCVNDVICCGAEPLFLLDYLAMAEDDPELVEQLVDGISRGCVACDMSLVGGETAVMPDIYRPGEYDMAAFCVGVAEQKRLVCGESIAADDVVIGVASSGLHSNGYSLVRKIVFEIAGLGIHDTVESCGRTVGELLLQPTRLYVRPVRDVLQHYRVKSVVHGIAHITGGGLRGNLLRILPEGVRAKIDRSSWPVPPVFHWIEQLGEVESEEMYRVLNMGIGLVLVVSPFYADSIQHQLSDHGLASWPIGHIEAGPKSVEWAE